MKKLLCFSLIPFALFAAGCGGESDEDSASAAVEHLYAALAAREGEVACAAGDEEGALLTEAGLESLMETIAFEEDCVETLENTENRLLYNDPKSGELDPFLDDLEFEDVTSVEIEGDEARLETDNGYEPVVVKDEDGNWQVEDPGFPF